MSKGENVRLALDRLAEAVVITETDGTRARVNPAAAQLLSELAGYDPNLAISATPWDVLDGEGNPLPTAELPSEVTRCTGRELTGIVMGVRTHGGSRRWLRANTRRMDDGALPCAVITTYTDVTRERELASELEQIRSRTRTMVDMLDQGVMLHDVDGTVLESNPSAQRILGLSPEQLRREARPPLGWQIVDQDGTPHGPGESPSQQLIRSGEEECSRLLGVQRASGAVAWLSTTNKLVRDTAGDIDGVVTVFIDITRQRAAEAARREATERFEAAFAHAPTGIALLAFDDGRFLRANQTMCEITGRTESELSRMTVRSITHPDDAHTSPQLLRALYRDGGTVATDKRYVRKDGSVIWASVRATLVRDPDGVPAYLVAHIHDITALKQAELARAEAHELSETMFASAPIGVTLFDLQRRVVRANGQTCEMFGRTERELIGRSLDWLSHGADALTTTHAWDTLVDDSAPVSVLKRYLRPDGRFVTVQAYARMVSDGAGRPAGIVSYMYDVTEARAAEQRQSETTAQFEAAFSDGPLGMAIVGLDGRWLRVNRTLCEMLGYSERRLFELTFQDITHPDDLDADLELLGKLLRGEIPRYSMNKRYFNAGGATLWITLAVSLVRDTQGRPLHLVAQIADITAQRRLEAELQHLADHDPLTELWNRRRFDEALEQHVRRCRRYDETVALLLLDLDGFKALNDTLGHQAGDELLRRVAGTLRARLRSTDAIARMGGDEFAVLLTDVDRAAADSVADDLRAAIAAIETTPGARPASASIGVAMIDAGTADADRAFGDADAAMYAVKRASRERSLMPTR